MRRILVTGSKGFLGSNVCLKLSEDHNNEIIEFHRETPIATLENFIPKVDFIIHLAGENK
jgi:UDP-2-acetamido-2,6-beta-L-arabino-hexul-4-ose reductase